MTGDAHQAEGDRALPDRSHLPHRPVHAATDLHHRLSGGNCRYGVDGAGLARGTHARHAGEPPSGRDGVTSSSGTACAPWSTSRRAWCGSSVAAATTSRSAYPELPALGAGDRRRAARRRDRRLRRRPAVLRAAPDSHACPRRGAGDPAGARRARSPSSRSTCCASTGSTWPHARWRSGERRSSGWWPSHPSWTREPAVRRRSGDRGGAREHGLEGVVAKRLTRHLPAGRAQRRLAASCASRAAASSSWSAGRRAGDRPDALSSLLLGS